MQLLLYITWNPSEKIGPFRWYGLCWLIGIALAYFVVRRLYKEQKIKDGLFDPLLIYCFLGILIGARLGHCIFYQPQDFLTSWRGIVEMILPIHFGNNGSWLGETFGFFITGYAGLASHGGTLGLIIALWLYVKKTKLSIWMVLDNIAIATGTTACFIRLGNLMNSEIIGNPTDMPWAFIFHTHEAMVDGSLVPRHPAQLYEALAYLVIFVVGAMIYWKWYKAQGMAEKSPIAVGTGFYFGFCLASIFIFRFFIEFLKKEQVDFEQDMPLDMGQLLSIPFVVLGVWCMWNAKKKAAS